MNNNKKGSEKMIKEILKKSADGQVMEFANSTIILNKSVPTKTSPTPKYGTKEYMEGFFSGLEENLKSGQKYERVSF